MGAPFCREFLALLLGRGLRVNASHLCTSLPRSRSTLSRILTFEVKNKLLSRIGDDKNVLSNPDFFPVKGRFDRKSHDSDFSICQIVQISPNPDLPLCRGECLSRYARPLLLLLNHMTLPRVSTGLSTFLHSVRSGSIHIPHLTYLSADADFGGVGPALP